MFKLRNCLKNTKVWLRAVKCVVKFSKCVSVGIYADMLCRTAAARKRGSGTTAR